MNSVAKLEILSTESSAGCHQLVSHTVDMHQRLQNLHQKSYFSDAVY